VTNHQRKLSLRVFLSAGILTGVLISIPILSPSRLNAQAEPSHHSEEVAAPIILKGTVTDSSGKAAQDAIVHLVRAGSSDTLNAKTDVAGVFEFSSLKSGDYFVSAEKSGLRSPGTPVTVKPGEGVEKVDLILRDSKDIPPTTPTAKNPASDAMEFADNPNFTVAGVTDWTAVGGHGSDAILRTSENLARETITLKPEGSTHGTTSIVSDSSSAVEVEKELRAALANAPSSLEANRSLGEFYFHEGRYKDAISPLQTACRLDPANQADELDLAVALKEIGEFTQAHEHIQKLLADHETAEIHRLGGEVDEKLGDALGAVHEFEQAARLDASEQNYFEWGTELLVHRAVWQAQEVFSKGVEAYPNSSRMLAALGTALFAGARYDEAASRLCEASDLNPSDGEPYIFMGKVELAAPSPLPCIEQRLARFTKLQPSNSLANYFYAMAIWKRQEQPPDPRDMQQVEALLTNAVTLDSKCSDGLLQLGILSSSRNNLRKAVGFYSQAIQANPQLGEAHYRLGVAYDRLGEPAKAREEFQLHDEIEKSQAAAIEEQRREVKQFLVVLDGQQRTLPAH